MSNNHCSVCGGQLKRPHENNANYVRSERFGADEPVEVVYAMKHTPKTREHVKTLVDETGRGFQQLSSEVARPGASETIEVSNGTRVEDRENGTVETATTQELDFNIPATEFEHVRVDDPNVVQRDSNVARTYTVEETEFRPKTGLICGSCYDPEEDTLIWGEAE